MFDLELVFEKTDGRCHLCGRDLAWTNYGRPGARGAWEEEHSRARANGGTSHRNNRYPSCIECNREKGHRHTSRAIRRQHGLHRAPMSRGEQIIERVRNAALFGLTGALVGRELRSLAAVVRLFVAGAALGFFVDPEGD